MFDDCPICLDEMANVDLEHPLQCQHHCGYNFCSHCIESLISSSKDDYLEASDGNKHVKVFLNCPQCRSDLSCTIRDTLLLRKVESYYHSKDKGLPLDESQQRLEKALATQRVQTAIKLARKQEATYLGLTVQEESEHDYGEEWGVEADLNGVHDSFHIPNPPQSVDRAEALQIDPTLFSGLDFCLQDDERKMITKQMTSGDPDILAKAAQYLWTVALHRHSNVQNNDNVTGINRRSSSNPKQLMKRSSVFSLISEAEEKKTDDTDLSRLLNADRALNSALQQLQRDLQQRAAFQTRFPLPVRMPKSIEFTSSIDGMVLMDYEWDGKKTTVPV